MEKTIKNSDYIKNLLDKKENTDSIKEKNELKTTICNWCYDLMKTIWIHEKSMEGFDESLSLFTDYDGQQQQMLAYHSSEYSCYEDEDDKGNDGIRIWHKYNFRGEPQIDNCFVPFYVLDDIEEGLKKYHDEKLEESQALLRRTIIFDLKCIKQKLRQLKNIPEDFRKITDNNFWDLISLE